MSRTGRNRFDLTLNDPWINLSPPARMTEEHGIRR